MASSAVPGLRKLVSAEAGKSLDSIDRQSLVLRHNPINTRIDPLSALSLGNGRFVFTADVTGLQTLSQEYETTMPLCTMSEWGWHTIPKSPHLIVSELKLQEYDAHGRMIGYHTSSQGQTELFNWLRENPHRFHLGRISFSRTEQAERQIEASEIKVIRQELDLWRGRLKSVFEMNGTSVEVTTAVHPTQDLLAVNVESELVRKGQLGVCFKFPYGSPGTSAADCH
jgi:hypothetical protein